MLLLNLVYPQNWWNQSKYFIRTCSKVSIKANEYLSDISNTQNGLMQVIIPRHFIRIYHYERQRTFGRRWSKLAESLSELRQCCLSFFSGDI